MSILQAIVLGAVQGLAEFIPISSSAHLVIIPRIFHWNTPGMAFDVALHLGTLAALLLYFWREWYGLIKDYIATTRLAKGSRTGSVAAGRQGFLLWPIVFACIPAALAGVALEHAAEHVFRNAALIGMATIVLGILLYAADRVKADRRPMEAIRPIDWAVIGIAQALAIVPGVSRSGVTITAGLFCGLQRDSAARFSFLLGAPVIFGAAIFELRKLHSQGIPQGEVLPFVIGILTAAIVGYLCIGFLINYLRKKSVNIFVGYRMVFGVALIAAYFLGYLRG